ncbi:MAG: sodium/proline symporter PutP [Thiotrichales bacterium]|nr:sodium/proline symporter PutP [Thiotrichales bacterium]
MNIDEFLITGTFVLYFLLVLVIGWRASLRTHNQSDYLLGGRRLGRWVSALSAGASDMSGWLLLGLPGFAYISGLESAWLAAGLLAGTWLNWKWVAPALRIESERARNSITLPDFFARRFPRQATPIRIISAMFILLFYLFYTSSGLVAAGRLFESAFGYDYFWSTCIGTLIILAYTCLGGFIAVAWTDLLQGILMFIALLLTAIISLQVLGGVTEVQNGIAELDPDYLSPFSGMDNAPVSTIAIISLLAWGLGYFGQPHILARFMAIRSAELIPGARAIAVTWSACCLLAAITIGMSGLLLLEVSLSGTTSEQVYLKVLPVLFHPVVAGICLAAILAAIMSTADSQLLVAASALTEDLYHACTQKKLGDADQLRFSRLAVIVIAGMAFLLALNPDSKILELVAYAWAGFGASFGPALLFTLFWKRTTGTAIVAGIIGGGGTVILWKHLGSSLLTGMNEIIPGFILASILILLFSLSGRHGSAEQP